MTETEIRSELKKWILAHTKRVGSNDLADDTPILETGYLSSLDIVEFVLYLEHLLGEEIDTEDIDPEVFTSINSLYAAFFT